MYNIDRAEHFQYLKNNGKTKNLNVVYLLKHIIGYFNALN